MGVISTRIGPSNRLTGRLGGWTPGSLGPTFWIDAAKSALGETSVSNQGSGGPQLNAQYGSTSGVDVTDPVLLPHTGTNYLYTTGVFGNSASVPNLAAYQLSEFDIQVDVDLGGNPAALSSLLSMWNAGNLGYGFHANTNGTLALYASTDGTTNTSVSSSVAATLTGRILLRCTRRTSDGRVQFFTAPPSASPVWTQLGTDQFLYAGLSLFASTQPLRVGQNGGSQATAGKFYSAKLIANPFGTPTTVFHADFTTGITSGGQTTFTESSANAATVTINRSTTGRKSTAVVRPVWLFGTDDYMQVAYDPYTAYVRTLAGVGSIQHTHVTYDSGTATAGAATTLDDTTKTWTVNGYQNRAIRITGGTGVGQVRNIASNTATQITVSAAWTTNPNATSTYVIESKGNVSGDIEVVVKCALDQWANGSNQPLFLKRSTGQWSYYLYSSGTGSLGFSYTLDGSTNQIVSSGVTSFVDGTTYWIRVRRTASTGAWTMEYAADQISEPSSWTSLASGTGTAGTIWQGTGLMGVGGNSQVAHATGKFYVARVRDGFAGTNVVYWDAVGHDNSGGGYCDGTARTIWTVDGGCSVVNANPLNFGPSDSFTVVAVVRQWATAPSFARIVDKTDGTGGTATGVSGWMLLNHTANGKVYFNISDQTAVGSNTIAAPTFSTGTLTVITAVRNTTADTVSHYHDNTLAGGPTVDISTGALSNTSTMRIGGLSGNYNDLEVLAVAVIPSALTTEQIAQVVSYYTVGA